MNRGSTDLGLSATARRAGRDITRREVTFSATMSGLTEPFMIPYALALGAGPFQAGLLSSFRNLVLSLVQLKSADAAAWVRSRRRLLLATAAVQAALWFPIALVASLFGDEAVPALIVLYTIGTASAAFGGPAWGSLVSEYIEPGKRGRFFGRLKLMAGTWTALAALAAGVVLETVSAWPLVGFGIICGAAAATRIASCRWLARMSEGPWPDHQQSRFSFWAFISQASTSNFAQFTLCLGFMSFAVNLAAPYMAVYMLQELAFGYLTYSVIVQAGIVAGFLVAVRWGGVGDRFGNWVVLRWMLVASSILPVLWTLSPHPLWILAAYALGGCVWGGFNLSVFNFVYDAATPAKRARCLAYFNVINGCGVSLGAFTGGWLLSVLPPIGGSRFAALFYCSAALRVAGSILFARAVREVRPVSQAGLRQVIYDLVGQRVIHVLGLVPDDPDDGDPAALT